MYIDDTHDLSDEFMEQLKNLYHCRTDEAAVAVNHRDWDRAHEQIIGAILQAVAIHKAPRHVVNYIMWLAQNADPHTTIALVHAMYLLLPKFVSFSLRPDDVMGFTAEWSPTATKKDRKRGERRKQALTLGGQMLVAGMKGDHDMVHTHLAGLTEKKNPRKELLALLEAGFHILNQFAMKKLVKQVASEEEYMKLLDDQRDHR